MGVRNYQENNVAPKYNVQKKTGKSIIDHRPVFSPDGESVLVVVENIVRVYNVQSGDCIRTLEPESYVSNFVAIQFPEDDTYSLCGCSETGCVVTWTWENGAVLRETQLKLPANVKIVTFDLLENNECFILCARREAEYVFPALYNIKTGEIIYHFKDITMWYHEGLMSVAVGWCCGDRFAAIVNGTNWMTIQNLNKPHVRQMVVNLSSIRIISVAAHKTESVLAIVDALGRSTVLKGNLFDHPTNLGREILHWHCLPVLAVCFSTQGSFVYTGGMERVLVKWTRSYLANKASEKAFIPRLPGMVRHIAANNTYVAAALTNNSIVIANGQMRVISTILECGGLSPVSRVLGFPLLYHHRLGGLLLGGRTGHLQLYSTVTDKVLFNIDITGLNPIAPERHALIPIETEVTCAAISSNGSWLVTSEYRNDGVSYPEERLKFWAYQAKSTTPFELNTCVNLSHGGCRVVSIVLNDRGMICVSAGADQKFRVWKREITVQQHIKKHSWVCLTACYYSSGISQSLAPGVLNNFKKCESNQRNDKHFPYMTEYLRDDIISKVLNVRRENLLDDSQVDVGMNVFSEYEMGEVAISTDGSLIAAWFGSKLTLWDTYLCNLRTTLSHPMLRPKGKHVTFGNKDAAHYLVCSTDKCVAVWSLLSLTVKWLVPIAATCLAADPLSNRIALATNENNVYVFTPHSSTPILTHKELVSPRTGVFRQCAFGDGSGDKIRLYLVRNDSEIYALEPEKSESGELEVVSRRNLPPSNFSALLAEQQLSAVQQPGSVGAVQSSTQALATSALSQPGKSESGELEVVSRRNLPPSNFSALLAEQQLSAVQQPGSVGAVQSSTQALATSALSQFLSAAPHMIPPVSLLCTPFLRHIAGQQETDLTDETDDKQIQVVDSSSEDEQEENTQVNGSYAPKAPVLWAPNYEKIREKKLQRIVKDPLLDLHTATDVFGV